MAIGNLGLAKHDYALAEENFQSVTELQPNNPAGHLGLAIAWRPSDFDKSSKAIERTMELNPRYVPGLHYLINDRLMIPRRVREHMLQLLFIRIRNPFLHSLHILSVRVFRSFIVPFNYKIVCLVAPAGKMFRLVHFESVLFVEANRLL